MFLFSIPIGYVQDDIDSDGRTQSRSVSSSQYSTQVNTYRLYTHNSIHACDIYEYRIENQGQHKQNIVFELQNERIRRKIMYLMYV